MTRLTATGPGKNSRAGTILAVLGGLFVALVAIWPTTSSAAVEFPIPISEPTNMIRIEPFFPTSNDDVWVEVSGFWANGCPNVDYTVDHDGPSVLITGLITGPEPGQICTAVISPWKIRKNLGSLRPGAYSLQVFISGGHFGISDTVRFSVEPPGGPRGVGYGPFRPGQDPTKSIFPSAAEIASDMPILSTLTNRIRTYSSANGFETIVGIGAANGLSVVPGAWLGADETANEEEIDNLVSSVKGRSNVPFVVVGSEGLLRSEKGWADGVTKTELIGYIKKVRAEVGVPVTTAEPWHIWLAHPDLADTVDLILPNVHPYWEGVEVSEAARFVVDRHRQVANAFPAKNVIIGETGWPTAGSPQGEAVPGLENQRRFIEELTALAHRAAADFFYFSAFDEGWKTAEPNGVGPNWGLVYSDRSPKHFVAGSFSVERLAGTTAVDTAARIAQKGWPSGSETVIVARADYFTDALAAGPLARYLLHRDGTSAPILLSNTASLSPATRVEIARLGAKKVYVLGGEGALSGAVAAEILGLPGVESVSRLWGETAYGTALAIKGEMSRISRVRKAPVPDSAVVATGENFQDSLAASGPAGAKSMPILLVKPFTGEPPFETQLALQGVSKVVIVGGPGAVHPDLEHWLNLNGHRVVARFWGPEAYDTALDLLISGNSFFDFDPTITLVTRGDHYADALAGGALASAGPHPMVLVRPDSMPAAAALWVAAQRMNVRSLYILGGGGAVSDAVAERIAQLMM
ncbi:MAG: cell wall-binding repeat-containing protein [Terriglobia bacterium]